MSWRPILSAVALAWLLAAPAATEIYRYTDEDGTIHFVSSQSDIPPRYRHQSGEAAGGSLGRVDEGSTTSTKKRREQLRKRSEPAASSRSWSSPPTRATQPPPPKAKPRKYIRDCSIRNANGRCGRHLNPEWRGGL